MKIKEICFGNVTIKKSNKQVDLDKIRSLDIECFEHPGNDKYWDMVIKDSNRVLYPVSVEDELVGYISCRYDETSIYISRICVSNNYRNKNISRNMIKHILLENPKYDIINVDVRSKNTSAISFYKKIGFIQTDFKKEEYDEDDNDDAVFLELYRYNFVK